MNYLTVRHCRGSSRAAARFLHPTREPSRRATTTAPAPPTAPRTGPVLTFLSPSPTHSRATVAFLHELFRLRRVDVDRGGATPRDGLDDLHFGSSPSAASWDSVACACPASGTLLHFLSLSTEDRAGADGDGDRASSPPPALELIAVHGSHSPAPSTASSPSSPRPHREALAECRRRLAESLPRRQIFAQSRGGSALSSLESRLRGLAFRVMRTVGGRHPSPAWILQKNPSTTRPISPLLDLTPFSSSREDSSPKHDDSESQPSDEREHRCQGEGNCCKMRELALPFFSGASSLQATLSKSSLLRPLPGLYQCSVGPTGDGSAAGRRAAGDPGLIFRPLPAAGEDFHLSPPSLVFQCASIARSARLAEGRGGRTDRIGWRGSGRAGSLIVSHPSTRGLDIRICEGAGGGADAPWTPSSSFDESTESLLAASLSELQSTHVASEGRTDGDGDGGAPARRDSKILKGDCWVEFRETLKNPAVLFRQFSTTIGRPAST